ncbi:LPXTG cell wall anchor domain-containing protein [Brenneria nigrifluens DSM 30175 = ATCC 13028]|uniref:LPXTG cell wall anchor domain-containing protein n=1 Tax=Brenneria nigrifluens DSM 30175 = ATCC 13028 TaxID=1121120 RepID=A0ABX5V5F5_9GAMM|nr:LPXTG cell wall anchor domain-containing protein [Brenneria nigrifluens DSM 30175 = ATCC 13028]
MQGTSRGHVYSGLGVILGSLFFAFRRRKKSR